MTLTPFQLTQEAVNIVGTSPHKTNKIAAALQGQSHSGKSFAVARTNFYPKTLEEKFSIEEKIGGASPTIHAEMAALLAAEKTEGAAMAITDLFCPNCAKYMAEAGVKTIYIDHKGFNKDWAKRNGKDFEHMSMRIAQHAGISVYVVHRKEEKLAPIFEASSGYAPAIENPVYLKTASHAPDRETFLDFTAERKDFYKDRPFAAAFALGALGQLYTLSADEHPSIGYTSKTLDTPEGKYSFTLQPLNRLMMAAKRNGLSLHHDFLFTSRTPTAREMINAIGAGFTKLHIGDRSLSRGPNGPAALKMFEDANIIEVVRR